MTFAKVFSDSFETFKILHHLDVSIASHRTVNTPKSIWQILNHLIIWQEYQLNKLTGSAPADIEELDTWKTEPVVRDPEMLQQAVNTFNSQIERIRREVNILAPASENIEEKLKIVQNLSVHLSFHLGEMILQMPQSGHYPMPNEMKEFLANQVYPKGFLE